jgi:cytochrome c556
MRHMWIDANRIASAGRGDKQPNFDEIWAGAADIARRSGLMQGYWEGVRNGVQSALLALEDSDRIGAADGVRAAGLSCDGCHMATWSPAYLHVTGKVVDAWAAGKDTPPDHLESDSNPPPEIPARRVMADLWKHLQAAQQAVKAWDQPALEAALKEIERPAGSGAAYFKTVNENAAKLETAARMRKVDGMREAYTAMRAACVSCHATNAGPARAILTPLSWE